MEENSGIKKEERRKKKMNEKQKVARTLYLLEEAIFPVEEVEKFYRKTR